MKQNEEIYVYINSSKGNDDISGERGTLEANTRKFLHINSEVVCCTQFGKSRNPGLVTSEVSLLIVRYVFTNI